MIKERDALLEVIAVFLGYKDNVTLRTIQNSYQPVGLADMLKNQAVHILGFITKVCDKQNCLKASKTGDL